MEELLKEFTVPDWWTAKQVSMHLEKKYGVAFSMAYIAMLGNRGKVRTAILGRQHTMYYKADVLKLEINPHRSDNAARK